MIIKCFNEKHKYLLFIDLEFNNKELIEFSGLLFKKIEDETYQLMSSCTQYVSTRICYNFTEYTNITNSFLAQNGIPIEHLVKLINEDFLDGIDLSDLLIISHGLKNDRAVLEEAGFELKIDPATGKPIDGYCTFTNAKRILHRNKRLSLQDIAEESGYYLHNAHNAYNDVWAEVSVFTYLKKIEQQRKEN